MASRDLKEAIENFKSAARPFQAITEVLEQLDAVATDIRAVKDLENRKQVLQKEQEEAAGEAKEERAKAKAYADQKTAEAEKRAKELVESAIDTSEKIVREAQAKAEDIQTSANSEVLHAQYQVDSLAKAEEDLNQSIALKIKEANELEARIAKAQASITKLLEG